MLMPVKTRSHRNPVNGSYTYTLSRNNMEFAGLVVYFFAMAVVFVFMLTMMLFQS